MKKNIAIAAFFLSFLPATVFSQGINVTAWAYDGQYAILVDLVRVETFEKVPFLVVFRRKKHKVEYYQRKTKYVNMGYALAASGDILQPYQHPILWVWLSRSDAEKQLQEWVDNP